MAGYEQIVGDANEVTVSGLDRSFSRPDPSELTAIASRRGALAGINLDFTTPPRTEILSLHPTSNGMSISRYLGRFCRAGSGMRRRCGACADVCARWRQSRDKMAISMGSRKERHGDA